MLRDTVQLHKEMFPQRVVVFRAEAGALPRAPSAAGAPATATRVAAGRQSADDEISLGVNAHAEVLLEVLAGELGDAMPMAPARMLSVAGPSGASGVDALVDCLEASLPNPSRVSACLASNMEHLFNLLMRFGKGLV